MQDALASPVVSWLGMHRVATTWVSARATLPGFDAVDG